MTKRTRFLLIPTLACLAGCSTYNQSTETCFPTSRGFVHATDGVLLSARSQTTFYSDTDVKFTISVKTRAEVESFAISAFLDGTNVWELEQLNCTKKTTVNGVDAECEAKVSEITRNGQYVISSVLSLNEEGPIAVDTGPVVVVTGRPSHLTQERSPPIPEKRRLCDDSKGQ